MEFNHPQRVLLIFSAVIGYSLMIVMSFGIQIWRKTKLHHETEKFLEIRQFDDANKYLIVLTAITIVWSSIGIALSLMSIFKRWQYYAGLLFKPWFSAGTLHILLNVYFIMSLVGNSATVPAAAALHLKSKFEHYGNDSSMKSSIDLVQRQYKCCGFGSYLDWYKLPWKTEYELYLKAKQNYKWYDNFPGLVRDVPKSCCDRNQSIICVTDEDVRKRNGFKEWFKTIHVEGCQARISASYNKLLITKDLPMFVAMLTIQFVTAILVRLFQTSLIDASKRGNALGDGYGTIFTSYRTRFLEQMLHYRPLLAKPALSEISLNKYKKEWIEKRARIGRLIGDTTFLRPIKHSPISALERFLRKNFKILEILFLEQDVPYYVYFIRSFLNAIIAFSISSLFTFIYLRKLRANVNTTTIADTIALSLAVAFMYTFLISTEFRAICTLMIPTMFLSIGRSCMVAFLMALLVSGPIKSITHNFQQTFEMTQCSFDLALNQSKDINQAKSNPHKRFFITYFNSIAAGNELFTKFKDSVDKVTSPVETSPEESKNMREKKNCGDSKDLNKDKAIKAMDICRRKEKKARKRIAKTLKKQYEKSKYRAKRKLSETEMKLYKSYFNPESAYTMSRFRERINSACIMIRMMKYTICMKTIDALMEKCLVTFGLKVFLVGLLFLPFCALLKVLSVICPYREAAQRVAAQCIKDDLIWNIKDGVGSKYAFYKRALSKIGGGNDVGIIWRYVMPKYNMSSSSEQVIQDTISTAGNIKGNISLFVNGISVAAKLLLVFVTLLILKTSKYVKLYLNSDRFDNIYITTYFEEVDARRKKERRQHLLPLKQFEQNDVVWNTLRLTPDELKQAGKGLIKLIIFIFIVLTVYGVDSFCYSMLSVIVDYGNMTGSDAFSGKILTAKNGSSESAMSDIFVAHMHQLDDLPFDLQSRPCTTVPIVTDIFIKYYIGVILFLFFVSVIIQAFVVRSRHSVCAFFFPKVERRRIIRLYNDMLIRRRRTIPIIKAIVTRKLQEGATADDYNIAFAIRENAPLLSKLLKPILKMFGGKHTCLVCDLKEKSGFFICPNDGYAFCKDCFKECGKVCMACMTHGGEFYDHALDPSFSSNSDRTDYEYYDAADDVNDHYARIYASEEMSTRARTQK